MDPYFGVDIPETLKRANLDGVVGKYRFICPLLVLQSKEYFANKSGKKEAAEAYRESITLLKSILATSF